MTPALRDWSLFIALAGRGGGRAEDFRGNQLIFRRTKGEISRNRHEGGGGGVRESHQKLSGGITSMK